MAREIRIIAMVLLPVAGIVLGIVRAELHRHRSHEYLFDITGYDPRDLLHGHYLAYRIELHDEVTAGICSASDPDCCLCLTPGLPSQVAAVERTDCETARDRCQGHMPIANLQRMQRYYIPEARADELTTALREAAARKAAQIRVAIDFEGVPQVEALLLDGKPIVAD